MTATPLEELIAFLLYGLVHDHPVRADGLRASLVQDCPACRPLGLAYRILETQ